MGIFKKVGIATVSLTGLMGVAFACSELPMPPITPLKVNVGDLPQFKDNKNPANAAFMDKLDGAAIKLLGEANWVNNFYKGYVSYTTKIAFYTGRGMVYIEKPCGKKAKEMAEKIAQQGSSGGSGGGGGTGGTGGGGGVLIGGGCYGTCGGRIPTGDVGPIETLPS
ncbi:hypothetical protein DGN16_17245 [Xanthomonas citri pv. fuscans]|uniref:hypothetical protein n=1 Tax=Xanthomonas citri TaxID=346 RepID=UPI000595A427|nr:hypothetical protein [Xanthomonas citri]KII96231.1 hypothetical protein ST33_21755 [Xanthomonas citri pv. fuscans]QWN04620.1 hypothetical protein DGN16_17245 [Xanthomonas citri pv. fuscans]